MPGFLFLSIVSPHRCRNFLQKSESPFPMYLSAFLSYHEDEEKGTALKTRGQPDQKGCGTVETKFEADLHGRGPDGGGGVALVSLSAQRETDHHSGGPGRRQDHLCAGGHRCPDNGDSPAGEQSGAGAAECDLPDGRGWTGRYHQAPAGCRRSGLLPGAGHR